MYLARGKQRRASLLTKHIFLLLLLFADKASRRIADERKHTDPFQNVGIPISRY